MIWVILVALHLLTPPTSTQVSNSRLTSLIIEAVRLAAEQERLHAQLRRLALTDELTGLSSRRGFLVVAEQQLRLAHRNRKPVLLIFGDLDGLKAINDRWGHTEGDVALQKAATALRQTFRDSDVIGRLGGDEFAVLAGSSSLQARETLSRRLTENLECLSRPGDYTLSISIGIARSRPGSVPCIDDLLRRADAALYEQKRNQKLQRFHRAVGA